MNIINIYSNEKVLIYSEVIALKEPQNERSLLFIYRKITLIFVRKKNALASLTLPSIEDVEFYVMSSWC